MKMRFHWLDQPEREWPLWVRERAVGVNWGVLTIQAQRGIVNVKPGERIVFNGYDVAIDSPWNGEAVFQ